MIPSKLTEEDPSKSCSRVNDPPLWEQSQLAGFIKQRRWKLLLQDFWYGGKLITRLTISEQPQQNCTCQSRTSSLYNHPFSLWITEQGGVYNTGDTVHFTPLPYTSQTVQFFNLDVAHSKVEQVNSFRFLWIHVTEELSWSSHISTRLNKAQKKLYFSSTFPEEQ